uniref:Uncharacterized protein n=1 Tax=Rhizophora mucronata TaxID=61149 RepID=A0A2P2N5I6_RHIMU
MPVYTKCWNSSKMFLRHNTVDPEHETGHIHSFLETECQEKFMFSLLIEFQRK